MAGVVSLASMTLSLIKTLMVIDAVYGSSRGSRLVARAAGRSSTPPDARRPSTSSQTSHGPARAAASKAKSLHRRLLSMHVTATLTQAAGAVSFLVPVSKLSCLLAYRVLVVMVLLFDASLVLFLLAKVHLTNGIRKLTCWEKWVVWVSRLYACLYLPFILVFSSVTSTSGASNAGDFCYVRNKQDHDEGTTSGASAVVGTKNISLILEIVLLLALFVKPLLSPQESSQSGGAVYKRVINRSVVCTIGVVIALIITTVVFVLALRFEDKTNNEAIKIRQIAIMLNQLVILCLTEIALPIGFTSCIRSCTQVCSERGSPGQRVENSSTALAGSGQQTSGVFPVGELPSHASA